MAGSGVVYRWDLDKTYLRTEFDTLRDLVRTAFEPAAQKRTVPGAAVLLRELQATSPLGVYIVSGSPEQMRRVLEAKLRLDGVVWDGFTLKPSLDNLLRGRFRFLRDQVGYKLAALLAARAGTEPLAREICFGDDAEADAFIYSLYADLCAGRVGHDALLAVLERARVYPDVVPRLVRAASALPPRDCVWRVFIHLDRMSAPGVFDELGRRVCPFYNYFQPALALVELGLLPPIGALRVAAELVTEHAFSVDGLVGSYEDMVGRGQLGALAARRLGEARDELAQTRLPGADAVLRAVVEQLDARKGDWPETAADVDLTPIDYPGLFSRDKARARAAKRRAVGK